MQDLEPFFKEITSENLYPPPTDVILDALEDFLVFSLDSKVKLHNDNLVAYLCHVIASHQWGETEADIILHRKILNLLHLVRPNLMSMDQSAQICQVFFNTVRNFGGVVRRFAFVYLADHLLVSDPRKNTVTLRDTLHFLRDHFHQTAADFDNADLEFLCIVVQTFKQLVTSAGMLKDQDALRIVPLFADQLLLTIEEALKRRNSDIFFPGISTYVGKALRLFSRLLEMSFINRQRSAPKLVSDGSELVLIRFQAEIPDDARFCHIFENYLMCLCFFSKLGYDKSVNIQELFVKKMLESLPVLVLDPFCRSRRVWTLIRNFRQIYDKTMKSIDAYENVLPSVWPMVGNIHLRSALVGCPLVASSFSPELFKKYPRMTLDVCEQICSAIQIMKTDFLLTDFSSDVKSFCVETWLDSNHHVYVLLSNMMGVYFEDQSRQSDSAMLSVLVRVSEYTSFLLDQWGLVALAASVSNPFATYVLSELSGKEFRAKVTEILELFCKIYAKLPGAMLSQLLVQTISGLLPTKPHHLFHRSVQIILLKALKDPSPYYCAFLRVISTKFNELFLPNPQVQLLEMTKYVLHEAFISEKQMQQQLQAAVTTHLGNDLFNFVLKAMLSHNYLTIELLMVFFFSIQLVNKPQRLSRFLKLLQGCAFSMTSVLKLLLDDPKTKNLISLLGLLLYAGLFCDSSQNTEEWVNIFIPALESENNLVSALYTLYSYVSKNFPQWITQLRGVTRNSLVSALVMSFTKLPANDVKYSRFLIRKIPDITCRLAVLGSHPKDIHKYVTLDGRDVNIQTVVNLLKDNETLTDDDLELLKECYTQTLAKSDFYQAVITTVLHDIARLLASKLPNCMDMLDTAFQPPALYSHLFFKHKYLPETSNAIDYPSDAADFLRYCIMACYHRITASTAISLIGGLLTRRVPFGPVFAKANSALFQASLFDYEQAKKVIAETMLRETINSEEDNRVIHELCVQFSSASLMYQRQFRKIAVLGMDFYAKRHNIMTTNAENRHKMIQGLPQMMVKERTQKKEDVKKQFSSRLDFMNSYSLAQFPNPDDLLGRIITELEALPFTPLPMDIQKLFKNVMYQDYATCLFATFKFALRVVAKLLVVVEPSLQVSARWKKLFSILKEEKYHCMFDVFVRYIAKELKLIGEATIRSLSPERIDLFPTPKRFIPLIPCIPEDVKILRFFYRYSSLQPTQDVVDWIAGAIRSLYQQQPKVNVNLVATELFSLLRELYISSQRLIFNGCIAAAIEVSLVPLTGTMPLSLPLHLFVDDMPKIFMREFANVIAARGWSPDHIVLLMKLLRNESLSNFRQYILITGCESFPSLIKFASELRDFNYEFAISHILSETSLGLEKMAVESIDIAQLMMFFRLMFRALKEREQQAMRYKPALFLGFSHVFLPLRFVDQFTPGSILVNSFIQEVVPLFLTTPTLFHNQMFLRRFGEFMNLLSVEVRERIFDVLLNMKVTTLKDKMFQLRLVTERSRFFHPGSDINYTANVAHFPKSPMFLAMQLNTVALGIAMQTGTTLSDIEDCYVLGCSPVLDAAAIVSGVMSIDDTITLSRLFHVVEILSGDSGRSIGKQELTEGLLKRLYTVPHALKHALMAFRTMSHYHRSLDFTNRDLAKYAITVATRAVMSRLMPPDTIFVFSMPYFFKAFAGEGYTYCTDRIFEICLVACKYVLRKPLEYGTAVLLPSILEALAPFVAMYSQDRALVLDIRNEIMNKEQLSVPHTNPPNPRAPAAESLRLKFMLQLISVLARVLYEYEPDIPNPFQAKHMNLLLQAKDMTALYKKAVQESGKYGGLAIRKLIMQEVHKSVKERFQDVSDPMPNAFATVAQWFHEVPSNSKNTQFLSVFLDAFKPVTRSQLIDAIHALVQPLHPHVIEFLRQLIEQDYSDVRGSLPVHPTTCIILATTSNDIPRACWTFDWFSIHPAEHLYVFARMSAPQALQRHLKELNAQALAQFVMGMVPSLCEMPGFTQFLRYYCAFFPRSGLAECFWRSDCVTHDHPLTIDQFVPNYESLFVNNLCEDALGYLKEKVPQLSSAIAYHQLSNYRAARAYYLRAMSEAPEQCYFYALAQLRNVYINVSLPTAHNLYKHIVVTKQESNAPLVMLPFGSFGDAAEEVGSAMDLPPNLSQVYLPFIFRLALSEEAYVSLREMQQTTHNFEDLRAPFSSVWMQALDKQTAMSSALTWRYTMLQEFQHSAEPLAISSVLPGQTPLPHTDIKQDVLRKNRMLFSRLLMKSGASYQALKVFSQLSGNADARQLSVSPQFLPRAIEFMKRHVAMSNQVRAYAPFRWNINIKLRNFQDMLQHLQSPRPQFSRHWLSTVVAIYTALPMCIDSHTIFHRIQSEISILGHSQLERLLFYVALCVSMVRHNPELIPQFNGTVLSQVKDETRCVFIRWLPHFLAYASPLPNGFLLDMFRYSSSQFLLLLQEAKISGIIQNPSSIDEFWEKELMQKEYRKHVEAHNIAFRWLNSCEEDISHLTEITRAHMDLYELLAKSPDTGREDIVQLARFCAENKPVFTTKPVSVNFPSWAPYMFVAMCSVLNISVNCDGKGEGRLTIVQNTGELRNLALISPLLYRYSNAEQIFISTISRMIENHQSSRTRSRFISYPITFMLRRGLMMSLNAPIHTQTSDGNPELPRLLLESRLAAPLEQSPACTREAKNITTDRDLYLRFYTKSADTWRMNYLQMRQNFASYLAAFSAFRFLFSVELPMVPSICFLNERIKLAIPGFMAPELGIPQLPLTKSIRRFLPDYVLKGSFTTSWHTVTDVCARHREKVRILLRAVVPRECEKMAQRFEFRARKLGVHVAEETEKLDEPFPFILLDHMIDTAENSLSSWLTAYSWI